jgi:hypothetical protein
MHTMPKVANKSQKKFPILHAKPNIDLMSSSKRNDTQSQFEYSPMKQKLKSPFMDTGNIGQGVVVIENTSDKGHSVLSSKQSSIPK